MQTCLGFFYRLSSCASSFQNSSQLAVIFEIPSHTVHDFSPFSQQISTLTSTFHGMFFLAGFSFREPVCLPLLLPPSLFPPQDLRLAKRVKAWPLPDKKKSTSRVDQVFFFFFLVHLNNITKSAIRAPLSYTQPPTPRAGLELGPPITVCQGACPNGARCQSTQELPRLKPRETLHLPPPLFFFSVPPSPRCLADDTLSFWPEMDVLST